MTKNNADEARAVTPTLCEPLYRHTHSHRDALQPPLEKTLLERGSRSALDGESDSIFRFQGSFSDPPPRVLHQNLYTLQGE